MNHLYPHVVYLAGLLMVLASASARADARSPVLPNQFSAPVPGTPMETAYWKSLGDPVLEALVEKGLSGNYDLKSARMRIAQAEAVARQAMAPLLPSVSAEAGYSLRPYDTVGSGVSIPAQMAVGDGGEDPAVIHSLSATLSASYLVDITGKHRLNKTAAQQDVAAGEQDVAFQTASLVSAIVNAYYVVCQANAQVIVVEEQIATSKAFLDLVEAQFDAGSATAVDVLQQRQQLNGAEARLPLVKMVAETSKQQLAVLIGEPDVSTLPEIPAQLPSPPVPSTGTPERLLAARADLRALAVRITSSELREKSAFRTLLPSLALGGQVGYLMNHGNQTDHGETWSLNASVSVPLYQGGSNRAALERARAATLTETYALQQAAVSAVGEVETALSKVRMQAENLDAIAAQQQAARTTFEEARKRYTVGLSNYLTVLTALASYQSIQLTKLKAELDVLSSKLSLMHALGGDWTKQLANKSR